MDLTVTSGLASELSDALVKPLAQAAERLLGVPLRELGVRGVDEVEMSELNERYGGSGATDVLSFPLEDHRGGDIVICLPIARSQAAHASWPVRAELSLLVTHGILHLLGYDHKSDEEKGEMQRLTTEILRSVEIDPRPYL